jgi:hypothetical protein
MRNLAFVSCHSFCRHLLVIVEAVRLGGAVFQRRGQRRPTGLLVRPGGAAFQRRGQRRPTGSLGYRPATRLDLADATPVPSALRAITVNL